MKIEPKTNIMGTRLNDGNRGGNGTQKGIKGIRNQIESWMHKLNAHQGNVRDSQMLSKLGGYVADMTVTTYSKTGDQDQFYTFENCFPTALDQVDVNWDPNDAVMEYTVTWAYDYWEHAQVTNMGGGPPGS